MTTIKGSGKYPLCWWIGLLGLLPVALSGCDPVVTYAYQVTNATSRTVTVRVKTYRHLRLDSASYEKQFVMAPQSTETVYVQTGVGTPSDRRGGDTLRLFERLDLVRDDSVRAKTNPKLWDRWSYRQTGKYSATYSLAVKEDDF